MQFMLLSLCLLSAAFTEEKKTKMFQQNRHNGMVKNVSIHITQSKLRSCPLTKDLIKNLVKPRNKRYIPTVQSNIFIIDPHLLRKYN